MKKKEKNILERVAFLLRLSIYSKDNRFQIKVGTFAHNKSSSTLLEENLLANWQSLK